MSDSQGKVAIFGQHPNATKADYDDVIDKLGGSDADAPQGAILHAAGFSDGTLTVVEVWENAADMQDFMQNRLMPLLKEKGFGDDKPEVIQLHNFEIGQEPEAGQFGVLIEAKGSTQAQYDQVIDEVFGGDMKNNLPDGAILHLAGPLSDGWFVFDVWESPEAFQRFGADRLMEATEKAGIKVEPKIYPLHNAMSTTSTTSTVKEPALA
jgi:hypothetical protein